MRESVSRYMLRLALLLAGLAVAHLGVTLFLLADLGADPFNVLVQGLFRTASGAGLGFLTHGGTHVAVSLLIIIVLLFADRSYIKPGTVICMVCGGPIIDMFTLLLAPLFLPQPAMIARLLVNCLGCVILALGMTVVISSDAGTGPNDLVALVISDKSGKKFGPVRMAVDLLFVLAGWLLGGSVGIGTLICALLVGPVAGVFMPLSRRLTERVLSLAGPKH